MKTYDIALLQGDGTGRSLAAFWAGALPRLAEKCGFRARCVPLPFGKEAFVSLGSAVPAETLAGIRAADAALLGAVDSSGLPESPVGVLRRALDLYADVRPVRTRAGRRFFGKDVDMIFIRESTQGFLPDRNLFAGKGEWMPDEHTALSLRVITYEASGRIARFAFGHARDRGRKTVTVLHKEPVFQMTCGLFLKACRDVSLDFPDILLETELVDNAANRLVAEPEKFDVLLTTNLFGDILSDEAAALVSSLAASANLGADASLFLPVNHQPAYAALEKDAYDPMPSALCVCMMLEHLGEAEAARRLGAAVDLCLAANPGSAGAAMRLLLQTVEQDAQA
jgi:isocitrate/isopropylmalate dehydrogenase